MTTELVFAVGIIDPCSLVGLLIPVTAIRPAAGPGSPMELNAVDEPIHVIVAWRRSKGPKWEL